MRSISFQHCHPFKSLRWFLYAVPLVLMCPALVHAAVIDFDDLTPANGVFVPQGYRGFSWLGGFGAASWVNNVGASIDVSGAHSGDNYAWSNGGTNVNLTAGLFDVSSLWVRNRADIALTTRTFEGWWGAAKLFSVTEQVTNRWSQVALNFSGIDRFSITSGANILIDDIDLTRAQVPEPATLTMLGLGLAGSSLRRRKR